MSHKIKHKALSTQDVLAHIYPTVSIFTDTFFNYLHVDTKNQLWRRNTSRGEKKSEKGIPHMENKDVLEDKKKKLIGKISLEPSSKIPSLRIK